jgi:hypothetical protein
MRFRNLLVLIRLALRMTERASLVVQLTRRSFSITIHIVASPLTPVLQEEVHLSIGLFLN